jgi:hypothetical protein
MNPSPIKRGGSSLMPKNLGLGANIILTFSALHLVICVNKSCGETAGRVVYIKYDSSRIIDKVLGIK